MRFFQRKPKQKRIMIAWEIGDAVTTDVVEQLEHETVHVVADVRVERDRTAWIFEEFEISGKVVEVTLDKLTVMELGGPKFAIFEWDQVRLVEVLE